MADKSLQIYGAIQKFDQDQDGESLVVSGILSTPSEDKQGDIVTADAMRNALGDFLYKGTCREMHQPIAAGKPLSAYVDDDGKTHVTVKVVDKGTISKIREGVLRGFSIGADVVKRIGKKVTSLVLNDASLVDRPANPECLFELIKFDKPQDRCSDPECKNHVEGHKEKCASCKSKMEKGDDMDKCGCGKEMKKGMKKCKSCMEKSEDYENDKPMKKMLCAVVGLPETTPDEDLQQALIKRLAPPANPYEATLQKLESTVSDLVKQNKETNERASKGEVEALIKQMDSEGRVAMKDGSVAYTVEELQKMDLPMLKILAVNAPKLPMKARAVYKGIGNGPQIDPNLKGFDKVEAAFEQTFKRN